MNGRTDCIFVLVQNRDLYEFGKSKNYFNKPDKIVNVRVRTVLVLAYTPTSNMVWCKSFS